MYWCVVCGYMHVVSVCYVWTVQMCECEYVGVHPESQEKIQSLLLNGVVQKKGHGFQVQSVLNCDLSTTTNSLETLDTT